MKGSKIISFIKTIFLIMSRGFYFYPIKLFELLKKIFHFRFLNRIIIHLKKRKEQPEFLIIMMIWFLSIIILFNIVYVGKEETIKVNPKNENQEEKTDKKEENEEPQEDNEGKEQKEKNLYKEFGKTKTSNIDFNSLIEMNGDTVAWISVDGTNINYPVVKTADNDYYLNHSFNRVTTQNGWPFMDYRNNPNMEDKNTIFYGHNLLNKTAFGSIANIFDKKWQQTSSKIIQILTPEFKYQYLIFSAYYIEPELYYLQTEFYSNRDYQTFLDTIKNRNIIEIDNSVTTDDKIITLSTCTEDNTGRKVIHAKLINKENR